MNYELLNFRVIGNVVWEVRGEQKVRLGALAIYLPWKSSDYASQARPYYLMIGSFDQRVNLGLSAVSIVNLDLKGSGKLHIEMDEIAWDNVEFKVPEHERFPRIFKLD